MKDSNRIKSPICVKIEQFAKSIFIEKRQSKGEESTSLVRNCEKINPVIARKTAKYASKNRRQDALGNSYNYNTVKRSVVLDLSSSSKMLSKNNGSATLGGLSV